MKFYFSLDAALEGLLGFGTQPEIFWSLDMAQVPAKLRGFLLANARDEEPFI